MADPKHKDNPFQQEVAFGPFPHAALTATTTLKLMKCPANKSFRLTEVQYVNVTGLAEDNANNFKGEIKNGSTVAALMFNTDADLDPDTGASIAADSVTVAAAASTSASLFASGDTITAVFTETGTATLPAGSIILVGRYV